VLKRSVEKCNISADSRCLYGNIVFDSSSNGNSCHEIEVPEE
jgi:hypothetical protein